VTMRFGGNVALRSLSLRFEPSTMVALIGPNGSGKSTLFGVLAGQLRPSAGTIRWRGRDITAWLPHRRCRAGIGRTFQVAQPFPDLSLSENVAVGMLYGRSTGEVRGCREALNRALGVLEELGLGGKAHALARTLSLGELKRVELAIALATQPALLLLDEVLAGQSPAVAHEILAYLSRLRERGVAICLVEHRLQALLAVADRAVALHEGRLIAEGRPDAVIGDPVVVDSYLGEPSP